MKLSQLLRAATLALGATLISTGALAQAAFSSLSLVFTQPTGTVLATDDIPIYVTLTNNDTQAFVFDTSLPFAGLNQPDIPTSTWIQDPATGQYIEHPFASYTSFRLTVGFGCSGSFTTGCDYTPYQFEFEDSYFSDPFQLGAGQSLTYRFGTFIPVGGSAPAGTYEFYRSVVWLEVHGLDAAGMEIYSVVFPAATCNSDTAADCLAAGSTIFTREVLAVPEPSHALMLGFGLAGLMAVARRRRRDA